MTLLCKLGESLAPFFLLLYTRPITRQRKGGITPMKHLLKLLDLTPDEIRELLDLADKL